MISVTALERLASWGSRYGTVCVVMKPFTGILYAAHAGKHKDAHIVLTDELWRICRLFQAFLVLTVVDEDHFFRPFSAFAVRQKPVTVALELDASLFGGGGLIMQVVDGAEQLIGCFDVDLEPLKFGSEARYQNCAEFIVVIIALRLARRAGLNVLRVRLRGDNKSMLSWAGTLKFHGTQVTAAACVYTFQSIIYNVEWVETEHLEGKKNVRADKISRKVPWAEIVAAHPELATCLRWRPDACTEKLVLHCDPRRIAADDKAFGEEWQFIMQLLME